MARIRSIHPGLFTDEAYMEMSLAAKAAWPGLWTVCDDRGVFDWKPKSLKATLFPADSFDFDAVLAEWSDLGVVLRVEIEGKNFGLVKNFCRFQSPKYPSYKIDLPEQMTKFVCFEDVHQDPETAVRKRKWTEQDGKCAYCGEAVSHYRKRGDSLEIDYLIPLSRGGTGDDANQVAACKRCVKLKDQLTCEEFISQFGNAIPGIANARKSEKPRQVSRLPHGEERRGEEKRRFAHTTDPAIPREALPRPDGSAPDKPAQSVRDEERISGDGNLEADFQAFFAAYRVKHDPDLARLEYFRARRAGATAQQILAAVERIVWRDDEGGRFNPHAKNWLKGGSWRIAAPEPISAATNVRPIDARFADWEIGDHMELSKWRRARDSGTWKTLSADHNALPIDERQEALWHTISCNHPKVTKFIIEHEPDGLPAEAA